MYTYVLETSSNIFESIQRLTNWNEKNVTGVFECDIGLCFGQIFLPLPCFLAVLVCDD